MMSASQASRRTAATESSSPVSVRHGCAEAGASLSSGGGDRDPGSGAVGLGRELGVQGVLGGLDQGVPQPGAVVAGVAFGLAGRVVGVQGRCGLGLGQQGGEEDLAVLGRSAALDPDPAASVVGTTERNRSQVRGAFLAVQGGLGGAFGAVGVDHRGEVPAGPDQLGRGQRPGLRRAGTCSACGTQRRVGGQGLDRLADGPGLRQRRVAVTHRRQGRGVVRRPGPGRAGPGAGRRGGTPRSGG